MAKKQPPKKITETEADFEDFDLSELSEMFPSQSSDYSEGMEEIMHGLITTSNEHMSLALELTKLVIEKSKPKDRSEEEIFALFKKASQIIGENSPFKAIAEKLSPHG